MYKRQEQANKALKNQLSQHDTAMQKLLQEHVNEDLDLISNHMMESRFYKYYAFLKNRSTVFEYAPDAQIILSSTEEVQDSVKHMHEEMVSYLQELFQEGISLHSFDVFTDLYSSIKQHSYMEFHQFVDYKKPITSQIMTMSLGDINLERTMQEVQHQARERRVLLCLNHKEQEQVKGLLEEANISWRNVTSTDTLEPGIQFLNASLPEGFTCLKEQDVYKRQVINSINRSHINMGDDVVVIGGGVMGLLHVLCAKRQGARVILSETDAKRRAFGLKLGADIVIDPLESDPVEQVKKLTNGRGANVVENTTAIPSVAAQAIQMTAKSGLCNMFSSIHPNEPILVDAGRLHSQEIVVTGTQNGTIETFAQAIDCISKGIIDVKRCV